MHVYVCSIALLLISIDQYWVLGTCIQSMYIGTHTYAYRHVCRYVCAITLYIEM